MLRRLAILSLGLSLGGLAAPVVLAADDPRLAMDFVQGLREKGLYDVALLYLDQLRQDPEVPDDLKKILEYEEGRTLIEEATHSLDPDVSKGKLEQAKVKIESFVKANPSHPQTTEALVDLAHLLYERGIKEVDLAGEARMANERESKLAAARGFYDSARTAYKDAYDRLNAKLSTYPNYIAPTDPRKIESERIRRALMQSLIQKSVVYYQNSQTYPVDSKERVELLNGALKEFEETYNLFRTQMAGITARMWQGKCFEELGKLGEASGIYQELLNHSDPALRQLQRQVDYYQIIVLGKRKQYALAADECVKWLRAFPRDRRTYEALGVQMEYAKDLLAQIEDASGPERDKAFKVATDYLGDVVKVISPFKPEAVRLLQKYRPSVVLRLADVSKLNFDEAVAQANQAISTLAYDNAILLLKSAIRKADPIKDPAKVNSARYTLAVAYMLSKRYYEAAVVGEHVARRYPRDDWAAKSADLAMQATVESYNNFTSGNRTFDLDRLLNLARYTAETWPETEQGDSGRITFGLVSLGRGQYPEAIASFEAVRSSSARWVDAQSSCGDAHWKLSRILLEKGQSKESEAEVKLAVDKLNLSIKARRDANAPDTDLNLINTSCDLALIDLETARPAEALALLDPFAKKLASLASRAPSTNQAYSRVLATILRGHVATGKVDLAIADMKTIEGIGGAGNSAVQLYVELGRLLEREIETLKRRNDSAGLKRTEQAYDKFLKALIATKANQTFTTLRWAADNLLKLGSAKEANEVYGNLLNTYAKDPDFLKAPNAADLIFKVRIKQASALRILGNLAEAETLLNEVVEQNKRSIDPQMELGYLLDAKAEAKKGTWLASYNHWKTLATRLSNQSPKPEQYYEAWYQAALALQKQGQPAMARSTLASVMRLSNSVGTPDLKLKYETLIKQLGK